MLYLALDVKLITKERRGRYKRNIQVTIRKQTDNACRKRTNIQQNTKHNKEN